MNTFPDYEATKVDDFKTLQLSCISFLENEMIPSRYTCDGININPSIRIDGIPEEAKTIAIIVEDPDVPHDSFCHWIAWNIPVTHLIKEKENRGVFGINDYGYHRYSGPCPFSLTHRYFFKVYALDCVLTISESSTRQDLLQAMSEHILGFGSITGKYKRKNSQHKKVMPVKTDQPRNEQLQMLLNERGKICVSIILPLHNLSIDQKADKTHLSKAIKEVSEILNLNYPNEAPSLIAKLNHLHDEISFNRNDEGLGLYVSDGVSFYTTFPFLVSEKFSVQKSFLLKEFLLKEQYAIPYNVLYIDEQEIRLYTGKLKQLEEIKNGNFPMFFEDQYEYQPPSRGTSLAGNAHVKSFEKDQSEIEYIRHKNFLKRADELLNNHFQNDEILILCGTRKYISAFVNRTAHANKIVSVLYGNYNRFTETDFSTMVWPSIKAYADERMMDELNEYNEKIGEGMCEEGIGAVWEAVAAGRGEVLLVEKNYETKGFLDNTTDWQIHLHASKHSPVEVNAVNELLANILEKNGRIVFVEDGMLSRHQHIALITRF